MVHQKSKVAMNSYAIIKVEGMEHSGIALLFVAFTLGIRHGFDLDHISMIDSMARNLRANPVLSRMTGILFSLGHGLVVIGVSLIIGSGIMRSKLPLWLDDFGNWISILLLFIFGSITLWNVFQKSKPVVPTSLQILFFRKVINHGNNPLFVMLIGVLFAFSFDTFSQVALFSISASLLAGCFFSGILGLVFMFGMMISDGINGLFVSALIQKADKSSLFISRLLGLIISVFSLTVAMVNLIKMA